MASPSQSKPEPLPTQTNTNRLVRYLLIAALILLPFSHFRWLPNLGTTRPISSVLFVLVIGLIVLNISIQYIHNNGFRLKGLLNLAFLRNRLTTFYGSPILLPWIILILLGIISAAFTPLYGNFFQALNRLLGYVIIFATLYCGLYARKIFSMQQIATYISLGYLPVLAYGIIEAIATRGIFWAYQIVEWVRSWLVVNFAWAYRTSYFTTEPSFVGFQLLLLIALMPFLQNRILRLTNMFVILIALIFSESGNIFLQVASYFAFLIFFCIKPPVRIWVFGIGVAIVSLVGVWFTWITPFQFNHYAIYALSVSLNIPRLYSIAISSMIRTSHIRNLIYAMIETRGLGLGIGQYGHFWKEIYLRHFDPLLADPSGEISQTLASPEYGRPWSVIFGIGVDLGVVGLLVLLSFFYVIWRSIQTPHSRAILFASIVALVGAYPIVTPHIWLALALIAGLPAPKALETAAEE